MRRLRILVLAVTLGMILPPGGAAAQDEGPLKIGVLVPFTGALSTFGPAYENAARLAVAEINAAGGVLGQPVEIVTGDTGTTPEQGVTEAERLVNIEGVAAIMGAASSAVSLAVAETVTIPNEILQISPASTSPALTDVEDGDFLFRMPISDAAQGIVLAHLAQELGIRSVCIMFVNNAYGQGLAAQFAQTYAALGGTVTASVPHDDLWDAASYLAELNQCVEGNPEALVAISYPWGQAEVYLREAVEAGLISSFLFADGTKEPQMFAELGWDAFDGMRGTAPSSLDVVAGEVFDAAYVAEYGQPTTVPFVREMYDSVYLVALAAEKAGSTDSVAIRDALRDTANPPGEAVGPGTVGLAAAFELISMGQDINYEGASGPADLDENGDALVGAIETWQVDCATETLLTRSISRVNVATGEVTLEEEITSPTPLTGDVNGDSMINSIDAAVVLQYSAGLITSLCRENADVNGDGTINSIDAALILQYEAGLLSSLPPS